MANAQDSAALHKDLWYNEVNIDEVRALIKLAVENIKQICIDLRKHMPSPGTQTTSFP